VRLGINLNRIDEANLQFAKQLGVTDVMAHRPDAEGHGYYDYMGLLSLRTRIESAGLRLAAIGNLRRDWLQQAVFGLPGWEEQVDNFCTTVRNCGRAGVPVIVYTFPAISLHRIYRTHLRARGRGGAMVTSHDQSLLDSAPLLGPKPLSKDEVWENYGRLLERVVPVAEEAGVRLALHPDDPPLPPVGGIASLLACPDDFRRAIELVPSDHNGLCFCQGCFTEMAGEGVYDEIRYFGERERIFAVHFRNLQGTMPQFSECFIDDGDVDMYRAMRVYRDVGYDGVMVPDHVPHVVGIGEDQYASWAFPLGYMRALMHVVESESDK
jgi:mannonate dehydratase